MSPKFSIESLARGYGFMENVISGTEPFFGSGGSGPPKKTNDKEVTKFSLIYKFYQNKKIPALKNF